ncbi:MAG: glycosyltransferase [Bryobacterales bacterium]|nr:glycosyltransferase [Bryobacterales bacterium]
MKILWVAPTFLHPTTRGGQIRTLGMLRCLHRRHEVHFVGLERENSREGPDRASEYSTRAYSVPHRLPAKGTLRSHLQAAATLVSGLPVTIARFRSPEAGRLIGRLLAEERFDRAVCDFLFAAAYYPDLSRCVLFQHNVETMIWRRYAATARDPLRRFLYTAEAARLERFERRACQAAGHVAAVSEEDARIMREQFGARRVSAVSTGVDLEYFTRPPAPAAVADIVFVGSMDWEPNRDGVRWFLSTVWPLIRARRPGTRVTIVGRMPPPDLRSGDGVEVTGTVPDVRPYLWGSSLSIVPLRIGGGTRLKIYESIAARTPVVSTTIGAEGLPLEDGRSIRLADTPEAFAQACLELLAGGGQREALCEEGYRLVTERFSWDQVAKEFERILEAAPPAAANP